MNKDLIVNEEATKRIIEENKDVCIVAATKYVKYPEIDKLVDLGITNIGENRVDSFNYAYEKVKNFDKITWHFIGRLQSNKVKYMINKIDYLHSLDRLSLAKEINKRRLKPLKCFIEINLGELNKGGVSPDSLGDFIESLKMYDKINILGFMAMAHNGDKKTIEDDFKRAEAIFKTYNYPYLSMGMSNDYEIAKKHSATHIRLGRALFREE